MGRQHETVVSGPITLDIGDPCSLGMDEVLGEFQGVVEELI